MRTPWNKLIKKDILLINSKYYRFSHFPIDLSYGEDSVFVSNILFKSNRITFINSCLYNYVNRDRTDTLSSDVKSTKKIHDAIETNYRLQNNFLQLFPDKYYYIHKIFKLQILLIKRDGLITAALHNIREINSYYKLSLYDVINILMLSRSITSIANTLFIYLFPFKLYRILYKLLKLQAHNIDIN